MSVIEITRHKIAEYRDGDIQEYRLLAVNGFRVNILNYGGIITGIWAADKDGRLDNVVLKHAKFNPDNPGYLGAITGRVAGRIRNGKYAVNNNEYVLSRNDGNNTLHGGRTGLDKRIWAVEKLNDGICLTYTSPDGENGFNGEVNFKVYYQVKKLNTLKISFTATTEQETIINLTNHSYFDLSASRRTMDNLLQVKADLFAALDENHVFNGEIIPVTDTPFDFRQLKRIGRDIDQNHRQLIIGQGYDHPFILKRPVDYSALLIDTISKRYLKVYTDEPCCVVYSANFYEYPRVAVCLETQKLPNAVNVPEFHQQVVYSAIKPYHTITEWEFGVLENE